MRQAYIPSEAVATHVERTEEGTMIINMGPQHPSTHGVLRVVCELEGERIVKAECVIGYLHTGMEKEAEYLTYHKALPMTDRMDYLSANNNNLAFSLSIEKILGVEIPPRGQYLRVILAELSRLASHLVWIGTHAMDLGAMTIFFYAFREREKILDLFEMMSGVRMMPSWICPGGLRGDMPDGFEDRLRQLLKELPRAIDDIEGMLTQNPIWRERTMGVGALTTEECFALGVSGPNIRATGFAWDIRKAQPLQRLRAVRVQHPRRRARRCVRPLPRAHGGDAREPQNPAASHRRAARRSHQHQRPEGRAAPARGD
jgi:NADH-quinone oxidoreductase subunit D